MIFWIVIREFKWRFVFNVDIIRYLWYFYYIPILCIPMLALLIAMSLGKTEEYHLPKQVLGLYGVTAIFAVCVLTNDLHQFVFFFSGKFGCLDRIRVHSRHRLFYCYALGVFVCCGSCFCYD